MKKTISTACLVFLVSTFTIVKAQDVIKVVSPVLAPPFLPVKPSRTPIMVCPGMRELTNVGNPTVYYFPLTSVSNFNMDGGVYGVQNYQAYGFTANQLTDVYTKTAIDNKVASINSDLVNENSDLYKALFALVIADIQKKYILTPRPQQ